MRRSKTLGMLTVVAALLPLFVSAQDPSERHATHPASTRAFGGATWLQSTGFSTPATQMNSPSDWAAVQRLAEGTRVVVITRQGRRISGRVTTVDHDTLQMAVRRSRRETIARDEVAEMQLGHRLGVAQHAGLGLLLGGVVGVLAGSAAACDSNVCGGEGGLVVAGGLVSGTFMGGIGGFVVGQAVNARPGRLLYTRPTP